jgi:hypothetical protein
MLVSPAHLPLKLTLDLLKQVREALNTEGWDNEIWWNTPGKSVCVTTYYPAKPSDDATAPEGTLQFTHAGTSGQGRLRVLCPVCEVPVSELFVNRRVGLDNFVCRDCYDFHIRNQCRDAPANRTENQASTPT